MRTLVSIPVIHSGTGGVAKGEFGNQPDLPVSQVSTKTPLITRPPCAPTLNEGTMFLGVSRRKRHFGTSVRGTWRVGFFLEGSTHIGCSGPPSPLLSDILG